MAEHNKKSEQEVADAICSALSSWHPEPLHRMAYEDAARAAMDAHSTDDIERLRTALKEILEEVGTSTRANKIAVAALNQQFRGMEMSPEQDNKIYLQRMKDISDAVVAERERCAKIAEEYPSRILHVYSRGPNSPPGNQWVEVTGQRLIAGAIRDTP